MPTYKVVVTKESTKWFKPNTNILHREDGPAVEYPNGYKAWYLNGKRHREDGPAIEYSDGSKYWYLNDILHREDGPAVEYANGSKYWYLNGKRHREDGPAVEWPSGSKFWYLNGECLTEAKWREAIQPQPSCEGKIVKIDGRKYRLTET